MPNEAAPTEVRSATTIAGNGPALKAGDTITAQFSAFEWTSSTQIATSWGGKAPIQTEIGADNDGLFGATAELQGVQVGSQRVIVVPAATVAANTAAGTMPVGNGDAIVLVIDILGSTPAEQ
jgi:peptidylprolyl isomerase